MANLCYNMAYIGIGGKPADAPYSGGIVYRNNEYDIWADDNPAAKALRENLPWHLSADEKVR